jgi:hypothetical protein
LRSEKIGDLRLLQLGHSVFYQLVFNLIKTRKKALAQRILFKVSTQLEEALTRNRPADRLALFNYLVLIARTGLFGF